MASLVNSTKDLGNWKSSFLKLLQKDEEEGTSSKPFYEARIILLPKPDKDTSRKLYRTISLMNTDAKILKKTQKNGWPSIPMSSTSTASINHRLKIFEKKIWKIPKKQILKLLHAGNYLHSIYIVFRYSNYPRDDLNYTGGCTCTVCKDIILYRGLEHPQSLVSMGSPRTHGYWGTTALTNRIQEHVKRIIHHNQVGLFLQCKDGST